MPPSRGATRRISRTAELGARTFVSYTQFVAEEHFASEPFEADENGGAATALAPAKKPATSKPKTRQLPPFKVLLHNDDVSSFEHVIMSIVRLTSLQMEEAVVRTLEAHETGLALLLVTHKERAELYQEQFASVKLVVTIEPDGE